MIWKATTSCKYKQVTPHQIFNSPLMLFLFLRVLFILYKTQQAKASPVNHRTHALVMNSPSPLRRAGDRSGRRREGRGGKELEASEWVDGLVTWK